MGAGGRGATGGWSGLKGLIGGRGRGGWSSVGERSVRGGLTAFVITELLQHLLPGSSHFANQDHFFQSQRCSPSVYQAYGIEDIYLQNPVGARTRSGFLVLGVIYDMPALLQRQEQSAEANLRWESAKNTPAAKMNNFTSILCEETHSKSGLAMGNPEPVHTSDILRQLGLQGSTRIQEKVASSDAGHKEGKLIKGQKLEELLGTGDGIRAKYLERLRLKKMRAEARREQAKLGVDVSAILPLLDYPKLEWQARPGSALLLRYLEERGVVQGLLSRDQGDLNVLLEQLGNYKFQQIRHLDSSNISHVDTLSITN